MKHSTNSTGRLGWWLGIGVHGLVVGTLLVVALSSWTAVSTGARIFRYQGF